MYKVIGADGKQYGPVPADQLLQWKAAGRVNAQTLVLAEGASQWRPLAAFPELMPPSPGTPPGPLPHLPTPGIDARQQVQGPGIALICTAILSLFAHLLSLLLNVAGTSLFAFQSTREFGPGPQASMAMHLFSGALGMLTGIVGILVGVLILFSGIRMLKLRNYGLAMTGSILAMIPCSACCLIGLPIGIWALVILSKPEVKSAFE